MSKHELVWEEEMYESIIVGKPREFLISFEGQVWRICIHFGTVHLVTEYVFLNAFLM